jgi:hypothetical protein
MKALFVDTAGWMSCADGEDAGHRRSVAARDAALTCRRLVSIRVAHQAPVEFIAATTKPLIRRGPPLLTPDDARRELEGMLVRFEV